MLCSTTARRQGDFNQLSYRLCGLYMTFAGVVSTPAPLKYAAKLKELLAGCAEVPEEPCAGWQKQQLLFV